MVTRGFRTLFVVVMLAAGAAAQEKDKVRVCHFAGDDVQLLSISRNALKAHLEHGDVEAPPSVKVAADCLVPQPPAQPVAATGTTDAKGTASFVIPGTNVIAAITATDPGGAPVAGARAEIAAYGTDYLVLVIDPRLRFAPAFADGTITEARPGSAPRLPVNLTMPPVTSQVAGAGVLQPPVALVPPPPVASRYTVTEDCFTQQELEQYFFVSCQVASQIGRMVVFGVLIGGTVAQRVTASALYAVPLTSACSEIAKKAAADAFNGRSLALRVRTYTPPGSPMLQNYPMFFEEVRECGGACCEPGRECRLVSAAGKCIGTYHPDEPCTPAFCVKGACCNAGGCTVVPRAQCELAGGKYQGDNTTCTPNPCNVGACCDPRTGCVVVTDIECASRGGRFHGRDTSCDRIPGGSTLRYTVQSGGGLGGVSIPIPFTHGEIRTKVTIPGNSSGNQCNRNWRVEIFVFPFNAGRSGGFWEAGQQFSICHTAPETISFTMLNPGSPCSTYYVNAITGSVSTVEVEIRP